ncbi:MAG: carbon-nitrogen hydrolase [Bryobacterales bacterium]|nr:carbon-nitrogen hydrolase [Bryobacterales bacterium]
MASPSNMVSVGLIQHSCSRDRDANLTRALEGIREAADRGARIVCLQELFRCLYFCQEENADWFDLAEPIPGPTTDRLSETAREHEVVVIGPVFERRAAGLYHNSAVVIDADGSLSGAYRKMHVPDDPLYHEKFYFTPGDLGFRTFATRYANIGVLICWDQWYPEAARLTVLKGAEILFFPTAIGWHPSEKEEAGEQQLDAWRTIQRSHAIANGVFVAAPNRVGHETPLAGSPRRPADYQGIEFWGGSFVCDPSGVVLAEAPHDREAVLVAEIDLSRVDDTRRNWPFLRDRRVDAYEGLQSRYLGCGQ